MSGAAELVTFVAGDDLDDTVDTIAKDQQSSGFIPWSPSLHGDPWNHVEAAMALVAGDRIDEARHAYRWLATAQLANGSWHGAYWPDGTAKEHHLDTNSTAYVATGLYHYLSATDDVDFARRLFPVVERAIEFVLSCELRAGVIAWSATTPPDALAVALVAGSTSVYQSLLAGFETSCRLGQRRAHWRDAAVRVQRARSSLALRRF